MTVRNLAILTACVLSVHATSALAQTVETVGIRAAGMGGAFVAVADDATAVYWNPGALAAGALVSAVVEHSRIDLGELRRDLNFGPQGERIRAQRGTGTLVALGVPPLGLAYYRLTATGFDAGRPRPIPAGQGFTLVTDNVAVNLLHSLADGVHVGASLRAVRGSAGFASFLVGGDGSVDDALDMSAGLPRETSWAFDVDAGALIARGRWRIGLLARNLLEPEFDVPRLAPVSVSRQVRVGAAFLPRSGTTVSADVDLTRTRTSLGERRHAAVGVEQTVIPRLAIRGGVRLDTTDAIRPAAAVGGSVAVLSSAWIDAQVTLAARDAERGFGIGLRFGF